MWNVVSNVNRMRRVLLTLSLLTVPSPKLINFPKFQNGKIEYDIKKRHSSTATGF